MSNIFNPTRFVFTIFLRVVWLAKLWLTKIHFSGIKFGKIVEAMHGDRHQRERENALERFKKGEATILVSTDVIGRGIDIKNVKTVINFDLPQKVTEYNNRIGRTARIGHSGRAISFYDPNVDAPIARRLCKSKSRAVHVGTILSSAVSPNENRPTLRSLSEFNQRVHASIG